MNFHVHYLISSSFYFIWLKIINWKQCWKLQKSANKIELSHDFFLIIAWTMEPLATTKRILIWMSIHPTANSGEQSNKWESLVRIVLPRVLLIGSLNTITACTAFIVKFMRIELEKCLFTFMGFFACCGGVYCMIIAYLSRPQVPDIFQKLSTIYKFASKCVYSCVQL